MFGLGAGEILVIGILALIFIGPKKLPELARGLGKGLREFQKAKDDLLEDNKPVAPPQLDAKPTPPADEVVVEEEKGPGDGPRKQS